MSKNRLEAFSDGVLAIIITIMVLELKAPHSAEPAALRPLLPVFLSYVMSFIYIGIYWNNHHHLLQAVKVVNGRILWANLHLLFWLSLVPFATAWMGENFFAPYPVAVYGATLLCAGVAYYIFELSLISTHGKDSILAKAIGKDKKGILSLLMYSVGVAVSLRWPWVAYAIYVLVALMWLVPDPRIERRMAG